MSMFKVWDKVVRLDLDSPHIYSIMRIEEGVFTIGRNVRHRTWGTWLECKDIRLATKEEIALGHRIDTNTGVTVITPSGTSKVKGGLTAFVDMGDDSHIENHVSPNCKKFDERVNSNEAK
ncbi:hypothetical protein [Acinetobacter junii]|uniref:hypothetical protein n=1 Tax=Acinetobacter junii TaxID=40215 RepID=UPI00300AD7BF